MRKFVLAAILGLSLIGTSAAKLQCSNESGSPQDNPAVTHAAQKPNDDLEVRVRVSWHYNKIAGQRTIEIATTKPGSTHITTTRLVANKDDYFDQVFRMAPGQRVSVTADQTNTGFLQCLISTSPLKTLSRQDRDDSGSVHCEWTRPVNGLG